MKVKFGMFESILDVIEEVRDLSDEDHVDLGPKIRKNEPLTKEELDTIVELLTPNSEYYADMAEGYRSLLSQIRNARYELLNGWEARVNTIAEANNTGLRMSLGISELVSFRHNTTFITDPFRDESSIQEVDPIEYYGDAFLNSDFLNGFRYSDKYVPDGLECPKCKENELDKITSIELDTFHCESCNTYYDKNDIVPNEEGEQRWK